MKHLFLLAALAAGLSASTLSNPVHNSGGGTLSSASITNPTPNNNNVTGQSLNLFTIVETLTTSTGPFAIGFQIDPSAASTEYFVSKTITNNSGVTWTGFTIGVGCGSDGLVRCSGFDPLLMDYDQSPTLTPGSSSLTTTPISFMFSNINLTQGQSMVITFSIDSCAQCTGT